MFAHLSTHLANVGFVATPLKCEGTREGIRDMKITFATSDQKECTTLCSSRLEHYNPKIFQH